MINVASYFFAKRLIAVKIILFASVLTIGGCGTAPKIAPAPSSLAAITINSDVDVLERPQQITGSETLEKAFTKLGADWPEENKRKFQEFVEQVDIQKLVKESVRNGVSKAALPMPILQDKGEANLKFSVKAYGFDQALEGRKLPMVELKAELIKSDGRVIWDQREVIDRRDQFKTGVRVRSWSDYQSNPALMNTDFSSVIDIVVNKLLKELKEDYLLGEIED